VSPPNAGWDVSKMGLNLYNISRKSKMNEMKNASEMNIFEMAVCMILTGIMAKDYSVKADYLEAVEEQVLDAMSIARTLCDYLGYKT